MVEIMPKFICLNKMKRKYYSAAQRYLYTMRKNLPKTLDQLNILKFTIDLVNVHKTIKILVNSYRQKDVKQYILTN